MIFPVQIAIDSHSELIQITTFRSLDSHPWPEFFGPMFFFNHLFIFGIVDCQRKANGKIICIVASLKNQNHRNKKRPKPQPVPSLCRPKPLFPSHAFRYTLSFRSVLLQKQTIHTTNLSSPKKTQKKRSNSVSSTASCYVSEALFTNFYQNRNLIKTNEK